MRLKEPLFLLLCLLAAAAERDARGAVGTGARRAPGRSDSTGENRLKLCGREFVRAVIFICGGSRWKRLSRARGAEEEPLLGGGASLGGHHKLAATRQHFPPTEMEFLQYNSDKGMEDIKLEQLQHIDQLTGQLPLKCLFKFYGNCNTYVPTSDNLSQYIHQKQNTVQQIRGGLGLEKLMESNNFPWVNSPRRKRDYSMGMSEMCCNWGCTKTEIGRLC